MKRNVFLCVDLHVLTQETSFVEGEAKPGMLTMSRDGETFEFAERARDTCARNMKVFRGKRINVAQTSDGRFVVNLRHLELNDQLNPQKVGRELTKELEQVQRELGL